MSTTYLTFTIGLRVDDDDVVTDTDLHHWLRACMETLPEVEAATDGEMYHVSWIHTAIVDSEVL